MNIIKCVIRGQALTVLTPLMADLTVNYFNVEADFSREWDNGPYGVLTKHVHIHRKDDHNIGSDWSLDFDNKLASTNGINLSAGTWEIWFSSAIVDGETGDTLWRLTTEVKTFEVMETGTGGGYMPDIPESNVEQITAIAQEALDIAQSVRDDADAGEFDGAPGPQGPQGPPGNYTKPDTGIPKSDLSESVRQSLDKADTALQGSGDGSNLTATFTTASIHTNITTGEKLSVIFGKIARWFSDLGTAAFKNFTSSITQGSTDLITSGAVHTGLAEKADSDLGITGASVGDLVQIKTVSSGKPTAYAKTPLNAIKCNRNLLDNWYFVGGGSQLGYGTFPINQRGGRIHILGSDSYGIDRWACFQAGSKHTLNSYGVLIETNGTNYAQIAQRVSNFPQGTITISFLTANVAPTNTVRIYLLFSDNTNTYYDCSGLAQNDLGYHTFTVSKTVTEIRFYTNAAGSKFSLQAVKAELGSTQTLAHQENGEWMLNEIPDYATELTKCQAYLMPISAYARTRTSFVISNRMDFEVPLTVPMVKIPVIDGNIRLSSLSGVVQTEFTFEVGNMSPSALRIRAKKTDHGMTDGFIDSDAIWYLSAE